jgi:hypothetical protein
MKMNFTNLTIFPKKFVFAPKPMLLLVGLLYFSLFDPSDTLGSVVVDNKPTIRVIYGGGLFGTLKPCG